MDAVLWYEYDHPPHLVDALVHLQGIKLNGVGSHYGESIDPIFWNRLVAVFQLLFSIVLSVSAGITSNPPLTPRDLLSNVINSSIKCYFEQNVTKLSLG